MIWHRNSIFPLSVLSYIKLYTGNKCEHTSKPTLKPQVKTGFDTSVYCNEFIEIHPVDMEKFWMTGNFQYWKLYMISHKSPCVYSWPRANQRDQPKQISSRHFRRVQMAVNILVITKQLYLDDLHNTVRIHSVRSCVLWIKHLGWSNQTLPFKIYWAVDQWGMGVSMRISMSIVKLWKSPKE